MIYPLLFVFLAAGPSTRQTTISEGFETIYLELPTSMDPRVVLTDAEMCRPERGFLTANGALEIRWTSCGSDHGSASVRVRGRCNLLRNAGIYEYSRDLSPNERATRDHFEPVLARRERFRTLVPLEKTRYLVDEPAAPEVVHVVAPGTSSPCGEPTVIVGVKADFPGQLTWKAIASGETVAHGTRPVLEDVRAEIAVPLEVSQDSAAISGVIRLELALHAANAFGESVEQAVAYTLCVPRMEAE